MAIKDPAVCYNGGANADSALHYAIQMSKKYDAARALTDAMRILEAKKRLDVVTIGGSAGNHPEQARSGPSIMRHLERHGMDARRITLAASRDGVGATIMKHCKENDPDVLVMGALGHARLREDLFGSLTRHILRHRTVPVMMAH